MVLFVRERKSGIPVAELQTIVDFQMVRNVGGDARDKLRRICLE